MGRTQADRSKLATLNERGHNKLYAAVVSVRHSHILHKLRVNMSRKTYSCPVHMSLCPEVDERAAGKFRHDDFRFAACRIQYPSADGLYDVGRGVAFDGGSGV